MTIVNGAGPGAALMPSEVADDQLGPSSSSSSARGSSTKRFAWSRVLGPAFVFVAFVAVWHWMHTDGMRLLFDKPGFLVPAPETVVHDSFVDSVARDALLNGIKWTAYIALIGLAITIVVGMALAILMAQARTVENSIYPYLVAIQAVPILAIVPVLYSMFGGGLIPRVLVCVLISIFPIVTNTLFGLQSADSGQHDLFTLRGANRVTRLVKLQLPAAMPNIFTGFRISAGLSVIGAVVGEQFFRAGSKPGIGIVLESYRQKGIYPQVFGCLILAAGLGIVVFLFFGWLGKAVVGHWHESGRTKR